MVVAAVAAKAARSNSAFSHPGVVLRLHVVQHLPQQVHADGRPHVSGVDPLLALQLRRSRRAAAPGVERTPPQRLR